MSDSAVTIRLECGDAPAEEIVRLERALRSELRSVGDTIPNALQAEAPEHSKAAEVLTFGAFVLAVAPDLLPKLVDIVAGWTKRATQRNEGLKVRVETDHGRVEITGSTVGEMESLARIAMQLRAP